MWRRRRKWRRRRIDEGERALASRNGEPVARVWVAAGGIKTKKPSRLEPLRCRRVLFAVKHGAVKFPHASSQDRVHEEEVYRDNNARDMKCVAGHVVWDPRERSQVHAEDDDEVVEQGMRERIPQELVASHHHQTVQWVRGDVQDRVQARQKQHPEGQQMEPASRFQHLSLYFVLLFIYIHYIIHDSHRSSQNHDRK